MQMFHLLLFEYCIIQIVFKFIIGIFHYFLIFERLHLLFSIKVKNNIGFD